MPAVFVVESGTVVGRHRVVAADRYRVSLVCSDCRLQVTVGAGIVIKATRDQYKICCPRCDARPKAPPQRPSKRAERYLVALNGRRA